MSKFPRCIPFILAAEGGLVNHPKDPGGLTNFGISQRRYPDLDIRALTLDQAKALYARDFWRPIQGDDLPAGLDLVVFDHAITAGPATAIKLLQGLTATPADGIMGPLTLAGVAGHDDQALIADYGEARLDYYRSLQNWRHFGAGWTRRVHRMRRAALAMAREVLP